MTDVINSTSEEWYMYERKLKQLITRRIAMFEDPDTFWGRNQSDLCLLVEELDLPEDAYHDDQFLPVHAHRICLLKRKYLNRLRQHFMKWKRQGTLRYDYSGDKGLIKLHPYINHINSHRKKKGLPELTDAEIKAFNLD